MNQEVDREGLSPEDLASSHKHYSVEEINAWISGDKPVPRELKENVLTALASGDLASLKTLLSGVEEWMTSPDARPASAPRLLDFTDFDRAFGIDPTAEIPESFSEAWERLHQQHKSKDETT